MHVDTADIRSPTCHFFSLRKFHHHPQASSLLVTLDSRTSFVLSILPSFLSNQLSFSTKTITKMLTLRWALGAIVAASAVSASTDELQFFSRLLKRQDPGTPEYNCHDNCGKHLFTSAARHIIYP